MMLSVVTEIFQPVKRKTRFKSSLGNAERTVSVTEDKMYTHSLIMALIVLLRYHWILKVILAKSEGSNLIACMLRWSEPSPFTYDVKALF